MNGSENSIFLIVAKFPGTMAVPRTDGPVVDVIVNRKRGQPGEIAFPNAEICVVPKATVVSDASQTATANHTVPCAERNHNPLRDSAY